MIIACLNCSATLSIKDRPARDTTKRRIRCSSCHYVFTIVAQEAADHGTQERVARETQAGGFEPSQDPTAVYKLPETLPPQPRAVFDPAPAETAPAPLPTMVHRITPELLALAQRPAAAEHRDAPPIAATEFETDPATEERPLPDEDSDTGRLHLPNLSTAHGAATLRDAKRQLLLAGALACASLVFAAWVHATKPKAPMAEPFLARVPVEGSQAVVVIERYVPYPPDAPVAQVVVGHVVGAPEQPLILSGEFSTPDGALRARTVVGAKLTPEAIINGGGGEDYLRRAMAKGAQPGATSFWLPFYGAPSAPMPPVTFRIEALPPPEEPTAEATVSPLELRPLPEPAPAGAIRKKKRR